MLLLYYDNILSGKVCNFEIVLASFPHLDTFYTFLRRFKNICVLAKIKHKNVPCRQQTGRLETAWHVRCLCWLMPPLLYCRRSSRLTFHVCDHQREMWQGTRRERRTFFHNLRGDKTAISIRNISISISGPGVSAQQLYDTQSANIGGWGHIWRYNGMMGQLVWGGNYWKHTQWGGELSADTGVTHLGWGF